MRAIRHSIVLLRSEFVTTEGVPHFVGVGARRLTRIAENTPERKEYIYTLIQIILAIVHADSVRPWSDNRNVTCSRFNVKEEGRDVGGHPSRIGKTPGSIIGNSGSGDSPWVGRPAQRPRLDRSSKWFGVRVCVCVWCH